MSTLRTKLSTVFILLLLGVFASGVSAPRVFATLLIDNITSSGYHVVGASATSTATGDIGSFFGFFAYCPDGFCGTSGVTEGWVQRTDANSTGLDCASEHVLFSDMLPLSVPLAEINDLDQELGRPYVFNTFTGTQCAVSAGEAVYFRTQTTSGTGGVLRFSATGVGFALTSFQVSDEPNSTDFESFSRIIDVNPNTTTPLTTIATGTPYSVNGFIYISEEDWVEGMKFVQTIYVQNPKYGSQATGIGFTAIEQLLGTETFEYEITHAGYWDEFSLDGALETETSSDTIGKRTLISKITKPQVTLFGLGLGSLDVLVRRDVYVIGTTTVGDLLQESLNEAFSSLGSATSTQQTLKSCSPLSGDFSIIECVVGLFIPSGDDLHSLVRLFYDEFATRVPWGYVTRLVQVLGSNATTSIPALTLHLPASSPIAGTSTPLGNIDSAITSASVILSTDIDNDAGGNIWDTVMPIVRIMFYLILMIMIVHDVTGIHKKQ